MPENKSCTNFCTKRTNFAKACIPFVSIGANGIKITSTNVPINSVNTLVYVLTILDCFNIASSPNDIPAAPAITPANPNGLFINSLNFDAVPVCLVVPSTTNF